MGWLERFGFLGCIARFEWWRLVFEFKPADRAPAPLRSFEALSFVHFSSRFTGLDGEREMPNTRIASRGAFWIVSICAALGVAGCTLSSSSRAGEAHGHEGAATGEVGIQQSPIDLPANPPSNHGHHAISLRYHETTEHLIHRRHTIELGFDPGSELEFDGETFILDQMHFHTPSEHLVAHQRFPVELHLVHRSAEGRLLVLGLLFVPGEANAVIEQILTDAPRNLGRIDLNRHLGITPLFPEEKHFYSYTGSLTTAPYTEGVQWLILSEHPSISPDQVVRLLLMEGGNARAVQPINDRVIDGQ